jgi:hypothetical protein
MFIFLWFGDKSLQLQGGRKILLFTIFFVFTAVLPLLNVLVLKYLGFVKNFEMDDRKERTLPYVVGLIYYAGLFYLIYGSDIPLFYPALIITGFILILTTLLVNRSWKISAHMMGAGAFLGAMLMFSLRHRADMVPFISLSFFIGGAIGFARLYLQKHTEKQVYLGYTIGLLLAVLFLPVTEIIIINLLYK